MKVIKSNKPIHFHKYKKVNLSKSKDKDKDYIVFKCIDPLCNHYLPEKLVEGKICLCNRCGQAMTMTKSAMTLTKPHCETCTKGKRIEKVTELTDFLSKKGL